MKIIRDLESIEQIPDGVVTIGSFDGIHLAHQAILKKVVRYAADHRLKSTAVTFDPHPRLVVQNTDGKSVELLTTIDEKIELFKSLGLHRVIFIPFSIEFSQMPPELFLSETICKKIGVKKLIIGYDHGFGRNRSGGIELMIKSAEACGFKVNVEEPISNEKGIISSTLVRAFLKKGDVSSAAVCLDRPYSLSGKVVKGDGRGKEHLRYPTANILVHDRHKCLPANGVYVVRVRIANSDYQGVMNIGLRPTFGKTEISLEVHLFDFDGDIYGKEITVEFLERVREEKKFDSPDDLISQIDRDVAFAKEYHKKYENSNMLI